jgi:hypothetical protein
MPTYADACTTHSQTHSSAPSAADVCRRMPTYADACTTHPQTHSSAPSEHLRAQPERAQPQSATSFLSSSRGGPADLCSPGVSQGSLQHLQQPLQPLHSSSPNPCNSSSRPLHDSSWHSLSQQDPQSLQQPPQSLQQPLQSLHTPVVSTLAGGPQLPYQVSPALLLLYYCFTAALLTIWGAQPPHQVSIYIYAARHEACQHTSAYVSIRQHTSAYVSICQHTSAYVSIRQLTSAYVSIRQLTSAYVSLRQHTSAYVSVVTTAYADVC